MDPVFISNAVGMVHVIAAQFPQGMPMAYSADRWQLTTMSAIGTVHILISPLVRKKQSNRILKNISFIKIYLKKLE